MTDIILPATSPSNLPQEAIDKALVQDWDGAVAVNSEILKIEEENIDALNRLAFAYAKLGVIDKAKRFYQKVLKLDPYNPIAAKNIKKLTTAKNGVTKSTNTHMSPLMFLEEPGKTKIVALVNLAPEKTLSMVSAGQEVFLKEKRHCLEVRDSENVYLGALPDDLSFKLIKFLSGGNTYHTVVKSIAKNQLIIFLRETNRGKKFVNQPSFVSTVNFTTPSHNPLEEGSLETSATGEEVGNDEIEEG